MLNPCKTLCIFNLIKAFNHQSCRWVGKLIPSQQTPPPSMMLRGNPRP